MGVCTYALVDLHWACKPWWILSGCSLISRFMCCNSPLYIVMRLMACSNLVFGARQLWYLHHPCVVVTHNSDPYTNESNRASTWKGLDPDLGLLYYQTPMQLVLTLIVPSCFTMGTHTDVEHHVYFMPKLPNPIHNQTLITNLLTESV